MKDKKTQKTYLAGISVGILLYEALARVKPNISSMKVYDLISCAVQLNAAITKGITGIYLEPYKTELEWAIHRCEIDGLTYRIQDLDEGFGPEKCFVYIDNSYFMVA